MAPRHVIVDGSNLATEGRTLPSLAQLDQAVREFIGENSNDVVTVVVDASFGHRIDPSELPAFEAAEAAGEVVSPPAGAIGRGDAFLLRIAEKTGATVLSNDSFQEFHGEHTWLFDKGRLIGGKPVPGVGWIFMERTPVRGAKSREVTKEAKRKKRAEVEPTKPALSEAKPRGRTKSVDRAIARATEEVVEPKGGAKSRRRRGSAPPAEPVNEPLAFITFIAAHPLGSDVVGAVLEYSSHGAFVEADGARCYIPLSAMGTPPPRRAREVVTRGESRPFVVQAFDPLRRGIELALPGFARIAAAPTAETVEAEIGAEPELAPAARTAAGPGRKRGAKKAAPPVVAAAAGPGRDGGVGTEDPGRRAGPAKRAGKAEAKKTVPAATKAAAGPAAAKKAAAPVKKAAAPAKKAAAPVKKAAAPVKKAAAPARKAEAAQKAPAPAKKSATKAAAAKAPAKTPAKKAAAPSPPAPAKKAATRAPAPKKAAAPAKKASRSLPSS